MTEEISAVEEILAEADTWLADLRPALRPVMKNKAVAALVRTIIPALRQAGRRV